MTNDSSMFDSTSVPPRMLLVRAVQQTDVGRVRTENQDFAILSGEDEVTPTKGRLMVVADGMGGHRGGATASRLAADTIKRQYLASDSTDVALALRAALESANGAIFAEAQRNPDLRGMGTTCSALVVQENRAYIAHVGDSRVYLVRDSEIRQLTQDHSLVATMVREGLLTAQEAEVHPRRNVLQRSMGVAAEIEIDVYDPFSVQPGDTFILCSDGLHGLVKEEEMKEVAALAIDQAAAELLRRALDRGAPDNVTLIVARVEEEGTLSTSTSSSNVVTPTEPEDEPQGTDSTWTESAPLAHPSSVSGAAALADTSAEEEAPPRGGALKWILISLIWLAVAVLGIIYVLSRTRG
ncbi:MAG: Stp1/IreP family PP2C-type Ser/Thr phosphatase [Thermoanaerobaculia bacterium]